MPLAVSVLLFFLVSIVASMIGIGGGVFYVPLLLLMHYSFHVASTISLFLIAITGFSAFLRYRKAHLVDWKLAVVMEVFTDIGAFIGGFTSVQINPVFLKILFAVILFAIAAITLKAQKVEAKNKPLKRGFGFWYREFNGVSYSIPLVYMIPVTFTAGYLSGLLGIAGGVLKVPLMILWFTIPSKIAIATSALMVSFTALTGLGGHLINTQIDWSLTLGLALVVFIGGQLGSRISVKLPEKKINKILGLVFIILAVFMTIQTLLMA